MRSDDLKPQSSTTKENPNWFLLEGVLEITSLIISAYSSRESNKLEL